LVPFLFQEIVDGTGQQTRSVFECLERHGYVAGSEERIQVGRLGYESGAHVGDGDHGEHDGVFTAVSTFVLDDLSTEAHQPDSEAAAQCRSELGEQPKSVLGRVDPAAEPAASAIGMGNLGIVACCVAGGPKSGLAPLLVYSMDAAFARSPETEPKDRCGGPGLIEPTGDSREKVAQQRLGPLLDALDLEFEAADLSVDFIRDLTQLFYASDPTGDGTIDSIEGLEVVEVSVAIAVVVGLPSKSLYTGGEISLVSASAVHTTALPGGRDPNPIEQVFASGVCLMLGHVVPVGPTGRHKDARHRRSCYHGGLEGVV